MEKTNLSNSIIESLKTDSVDLFKDVGEVTLDIFMEDGIARDIPIVGSVCSIFKIGHTISELAHLRRFYYFIQAFEAGNISEADRQKRIARLKENEHSSESELEYLISVLEKYTENDQSVLLAKLYLSYLDKEISWIQMRQYALIINQLLPGDVDVLKKGSFKTTNYYVSSPSHLRLVSLGLMTEMANIEEQTYELMDGGSEKHLALTGEYRQYELTEFGITFLKSIDQFSEEHTLLLTAPMDDRKKRHMDSIREIHFK